MHAWTIKNVGLSIEVLIQCFACIGLWCPLKSALAFRVMFFTFIAIICCICRWYKKTACHPFSEYWAISLYLEYVNVWDYVCTKVLTKLNFVSFQGANNMELVVILSHKKWFCKFKMFCNELLKHEVAFRINLYKILEYNTWIQQYIFIFINLMDWTKNISSMETDVW